MGLYQFIPLNDLLSNKPAVPLLPVVSEVNLHTTLFALMVTAIETAIDEDMGLFITVAKYLDDYTINYADLVTSNFTLNYPLDLDYASIVKYANELRRIVEK